MEQNIGLLSTNLFKLNNGLYLIKTSKKQFNFKGNLKQTINHLFFLGVEEKEIFYGIELMELNSHSYCNFGIFGSVIFTDNQTPDSLSIR